MKTLTYLRVSSRGQIDGDGFDRQRHTINNWMDRNSADHMGEFVEEGISGTSEITGRPALTRLMERVSMGGIDAVVIEKSDRLARDLVVSELLLRQFREMGIKVIEAEGGNDLTADENNPTAKLIRQVLGAFAEFEKSSIVQKLRVARNRKRAADGRCEGNKPYGSLEGEEAVVSVIRNLRDEGLTLRKIAGELDTRGIRNRSGGQWSAGVVGRVVRTMGVNQ